MTEALSDADEHHVRHLLRAVGHARPEPFMPDKPVTPTRIIRAGAPLPARPPQAGDVPPWRQPPPPPPPPAMPVPPPVPPPPAEVIVHVVYPLPPEPELVPPWWGRAWDWLAQWRVLTALGTALIPWMGGTSPVGAWAHTLHQARTEAGIVPGYVIAGTALAATWALDRRTGRWLPRVLYTTALVGSFGAVAWWDPIQAITGVSR
jgi:hypothetical protein